MNLNRNHIPRAKAKEESLVKNLQGPWWWEAAKFHRWYVRIVWCMSASMKQLRDRIIMDINGSYLYRLWPFCFTSTMCCLDFRRIVPPEARPYHLLLPAGDVALEGSERSDRCHRRDYLLLGHVDWYWNPQNDGFIVVCMQPFRWNKALPPENGKVHWRLKHLLLKNLPWDH